MKYAVNTFLIACALITVTSFGATSSSYTQRAPADGSSHRRKGDASPRETEKTTRSSASGRRRSALKRAREKNLKLSDSGTEEGNSHAADLSRKCDDRMRAKYTNSIAGKQSSGSPPDRTGGSTTGSVTDIEHDDSDLDGDDDMYSNVDDDDDDDDVESERASDETEAMKELRELDRGYIRRTQVSTRPSGSKDGQSSRRRQTSKKGRQHDRRYGDYNDGYPVGDKSTVKQKQSVMKTMGSATSKSMKAVVHALQPKAVGLGDVLDSWKIEQSIGKAPGPLTRCAATVEFRRDGTVSTTWNGQETVSDFKFRARSWPRACTIEFEAKAFQGPWDDEPVWKLYKGSFSRNLLDPKIVTLEGRIYDIKGKMMWKRQVRSGNFVARRRPSRVKGASHHTTRRREDLTDRN